MTNDNELRRKALMDSIGGMAGDDAAGQPIQNTGIGGGVGLGSGMEMKAEKMPAVLNSAEPGGVAGPAAGPLVDAPSAAPARTSNFGSLMGYDSGKLNDPNKHDFKYDTARVMSQFDPRQGFTPEVLDALNKLDYGTFSSSGKDKLSLSGAKNAKDAADFADQDWIYAKDANNDATKWMFGGGGAGGGGGAQGGAPIHGGGMSAPALGGMELDSSLQGDPQAALQQLLAQMGGSQPNLAALLQQLGVQ